MIKIYRDFIEINQQIMEKAWYSDINAKMLFFHLAFKTRWKSEKFQGVTIPVGSLATSPHRLTDETGISLEKINWALALLERSDEIAVKKHNEFIEIAIKNCSVQE